MVTLISDPRTLPYNKRLPVHDTYQLSESLHRLVATVNLQRNWRVLDAATIAGRAACVLAPRVAHVWAAAITTQMVNLTTQRVRDRGINNVTVEYGNVERLSYPADFFDLVVCEMIPHQLDARRMIAEAKKVLRPGGLLAIIDDVLPSGPAGDFVHVMEGFCNPSGRRTLRISDWTTLLCMAGFQVRHLETMDRPVYLEEWAGRRNLVQKQFLRTMLIKTDGEIATSLRPHTENNRTQFHLQEALLIAEC